MWSDGIPGLNQNIKMKCTSFVWVLLYLLSSNHTAFSQYDFEKYPKIKFEREFAKFDDWVVEEVIKDGLFPEHLLKGISKFFNDGSPLYFEVMPIIKSENGSKIYIYKDKKVIFTYITDLPVSSSNLMKFGIVDIDGNGFKDIALEISYMGNGTASLNVKNIFFFQITDAEFKVIAFDDKSFDSWHIYDINMDKNFEIFSQHFQGHENHNYFLFNVYRFNGEELINVNDELNYPIMVQYLYKANNKITKNLSRKAMKRYSIEDPTRY